MRNDDLHKNRLRERIPESEKMIKDGTTGVQPSNNRSIDYRHISNKPEEKPIPPCNCIKSVETDSSLNGDGTLSNPLNITRHYSRIVTVTLMAGGWDLSLQQTIAVSGMTAMTDFIVYPALPYANLQNASRGLIAAVAQGLGLVTFESIEEPVDDIDMHIIIIEE